MPWKSINSAPASAKIPSQPCAGNARRRRRRKNPATRTAAVTAVIARPSASFGKNTGAGSVMGLSAYGSADGRSFRQAPGRFLLCSACFFGRHTQQKRSHERPTAETQRPQRGNGLSEAQKLERGLGLVEATSLNMTFMVGIGPFVVIPMVVKAMGGPGSLLAWVAGALLAVFDGCIWAELGAAMPQAGGSYVYLREAYGALRWGRLLSFLYIWQTLFQGPLSIASGALGFADYSTYLVAKSSRLAGIAAALGTHSKNAIAGLVVLLVVALLYRRITEIGRISVIFSVIVIGTILWIIWGGAAHFDARRVFD